MSTDHKIDPVNIFLEFLEVSIHNILFLRKLYPDGIFTLKKKYGVPVHVSLYPELNAYITESLLAVKKLMTCNDLRQVDLCFCDRYHRLLEKFVFSLSFIKSEVAPSELSEGTDEHVCLLKQAMRAFCLKLAVSTSYLSPLPNNASFKILVHTSESSMSALSNDASFQNVPFLEVERQEVIMEEPEVVPVKSVDTALFKIETFIERSSSSSL